MGQEEQKLPVGWVETDVGALGKWSSGGTPSKKRKEYFSGNIPWVLTGDLEDKPIKTVTNSITQAGLKNSSAKLFPAGTLLIAMYGATIGKLGILEIEAATNQACAAFLPEGYSADIIPYLFYYFLFKRSHLREIGKGGAQPNISQTVIKEQPIPLAPLNEQRRIVEKIETLFSDLDKGEEHLRATQKLLKRYRQSVLKAAVTGELTRDWREENRHRLESGEHLLQRILHTRREQWQGRGKYKEPVAPNTTNLPDLPEGWVWTSLDSISQNQKHAIKAGPFGSALKKEYYVKKGYKIYGQEQVISGDSEYGDYYVDEKKYRSLESCKVQPKDILISLVGTIGKVLVLPEGIEEGIINPRLIKISLRNEIYNSLFFKYYFESQFLKSLYKLKAHGATMDILNLNIIRSLPYILCPIEEQKEIVDRIDDIFSQIDALEAWCATELKRSGTLRQSVLKSAFSGQLVPQDPADEPASELLKRIQAERAASPQKRKKA